MPLKCNFCFSSVDDSVRLISSPSYLYKGGIRKKVAKQVYICSSCVETCIGILFLEIKDKKGSKKNIIKDKG